VNCYHSSWDHHSDVEGGLRNKCGETDRASAALIRDLKQRGLLDDTLVIWGGEFGRTPMVESSAALGRSLGRDHHPQAFTMWMAGGGVKAGQTLGATDELGFHIAEDPVHVHDIQATILHLLGLDHTRLTYRHLGRDFRLTDVFGELVPELHRGFRRNRASGCLARPRRGRDRPPKPVAASWFLSKRAS
jgi:arylsulfatase A-like enzyme